jgi:hypothetical protein
MSVVVLLAPSAALAATTNPSITVEAEYGSVVIEGSLYTAAHHQPVGSKYAGHHVGGSMPSPCNDTNIPAIEDGTILVSHVDLDTFGGVLRALGAHELFGTEHEGFWNLAEYVDVTGPHKVLGSGAEWSNVRKLYAYWAHAKGAKWLPRDVVSDITDLVRDTRGVLAKILAGNGDLLRAGDAFRLAGEELNSASFVRLSGNVVERSSDQFVNHLYLLPRAFSPRTTARAVVALNTKTGAVTLSLEGPTFGVSCRDIAQKLWGPEAGGHDGIAGSPRERTMTAADAADAVEALNAAMEGR